MRWLTTQSLLPQMAMAPRCPYLPMPSVTSAMMTMMSTTRPPERRRSRLSSTSWCATRTRPRATTAKIGFSSASTATESASAKSRRALSLRRISQKTISAATTTGISVRVK